MLECKICGCKFNAVEERHYISRDNGKSGLAVAFGSEPEENCTILLTALHAAARLRLRNERESISLAVKPVRRTKSNVRIPWQNGVAPGTLSI